MSAVIRSEDHFTSGDVVRDVVIGMSDGLTVPIALAAGISGAVQPKTCRSSLTDKSIS